METDRHFDTLQDFKNALEKWSVDAKFRYRVKKSDRYAHFPPKLQLLTGHGSFIIRKRSIIICAVKECPFYIHAAWSKRKECVVVSSIQQMYTYLDPDRPWALPIQASSRAALTLASGQ